MENLYSAPKDGEDSKAICVMGERSEDQLIGLCLTVSDERPG
jgi:hypothetical protein